MTINLIHGLGSRVNYLARVIALDEGHNVDWCIGPECPCGHRVVFPNGIDGLEIFDSPVGQRIGHLWNPPVDEAKLPEAVRRIFAAMGLPPVEECELGVMFRGRFWDGLTIPEFEPAILFAMLETSGPVATLCDSLREEVCGIIGQRAMRQTSRPMAHDMDRTESDARPYLAEWWRLLNCRRIVTNCHQSSILWPFRFLTSLPD
jgi:hypothetical protein